MCQIRDARKELITATEPDYASTISAMSALQRKYSLNTDAIRVRSITMAIAILLLPSWIKSESLIGQLIFKI